MTNEIVIHPIYSKLNTELKNLKNELSKKILEEDELKYHICKNIEAEYMLKIGYLDYKIFEKEVNISMIKKEINLIQKSINKNENVDIESIEKEIVIEYEKYFIELEKDLSKLDELTNRLNTEKLSSKDSEKLKEIYKKLILKVHPDLNDDSDEELFFKIVETYENGDLDTLKLIYELEFDKIEKKPKNDSIEKIKKQIDLLKIRISLIDKDIDKIKSTHPYNKKELLKDDFKIRKTKNELENRLKKYDDSYNQYSKKLENLMRTINEKKI